MHSPRTLLHRQAGRKITASSKPLLASRFQRHRRLGYRTQAADSQHNRNATAPVSQPPALPQQDHVDTYHGQIRRDEYSWMSEKGPTDPEILGYLKSESQYTISSLAHTRDLQLRLQHSLQAWQQAQQEAVGDSEQQRKSPQPQVVRPDWLAGNGLLQCKQCKQFGEAGAVVGQYRFFSTPTTSSSGGSSTAGLIHCRAPARAPHTAVSSAAAAAAAAASSSGKHSVGTNTSSSSSGQTAAVVPPPGTVVLWDETGSTTSSSSKFLNGCRSYIHSLSVSPCGCYLAVTYSSSWVSSSTYDLAVVSCSTGQVLLQPVQGVDGPVLWVTQTAAAVNAAAAAEDAGSDAAVHGVICCPSAQRQQQLQQQQQQHGQQQKQYLLYVDDDYREVHCLELDARAAVASSHDSESRGDVLNTCTLNQPPSTAKAATAQAVAAKAATAQAVAAPAAPADRTTPAPRLIYKDPQHVSLNIAAEFGCTFITVFGSDGLIRQVLFYSSTGGETGLTPGQPAAWRPLLPAATIARMLAASADGSTDNCSSTSGSSTSSSAAADALTSSGDDDPTCRLAVTGVDGLLLVRHNCSALPQGHLWLGRLAQQPGQHPQQTLMDWQLLLGAQDDLYLEAVFLCCDHSSSSSSSTDRATGSSSGSCHVDQALQLVVLGWKPYDWQQQQQQQQQRQQLEAQLYRVVCSQRDPEQQQQQQQPFQAQLQYSCIVPVPDAFFEVHGASWHAQQCELQLEFSSFTRPRSRIDIKLAPHLPQEHQLQQSLQEGRMLTQQRSEAVLTPDSCNSAVAGSVTRDVTTATAAQFQIKQLVAAPAGCTQSEYATLQIGVPSVDYGVVIPVSVAYNRNRVQLPSNVLDHHQQQQQQQYSCTSDPPLHGDNRKYQEGATPAAAARMPPQRMLLSCYGSYGIREGVAFSPEFLLLLDAGWLVAVAHVRGGGWCGRAWAEAGRGLGKTNSVKDLLGVAEYAHKVGLVSPGQLCLQGASAGGWLAASAMLQQPQLFAAVVLTVPCLDPLGALLQHNQSALELGPAASDPEVCTSIRSWAPYDLLEQMLYPDAQQCQQTEDQLASVVLTGSATCLEQQHQQPQHQGSSSVRYVPWILIRAALGDQEVPISDPIKTLARLRCWCSMGSQQQQMLGQGRPVAAVPGSGPSAVNEENSGGDCCGSESATSLTDPSNRMPLLRVVPGGHTAFQGSVRESALKVAFLLTAVGS